MYAPNKKAHPPIALISTWDTRNITSLADLLHRIDDARKFNHNLNDWDTMNVKT